MFTIEQIRQAHTKVKSGSDFPGFIQDIKKLGVKSYETFVSDGHTIYFGAIDYEVIAPAKYDLLEIAETPDIDQFRSDLKAHQLGKTNFPMFCILCAELGVEKWGVDTEKMTCTYYDKSGKLILVEEIPA